MPFPLQTSTDVGRLVAELKTYLAALNERPLNGRNIAVAWDAFRGTFGSGEGTADVSVDGLRLADTPGLKALIQKSEMLTGEVGDLLNDLLDMRSDVEVVARAQSLGEAPDDKPARNARSTLRKVIGLLEDPQAIGRGHVLSPEIRAPGRNRRGTKKLKTPKHDWLDKKIMSLHAKGDRHKETLQKLKTYPLHHLDFCGDTPRHEAKAIIDKLTEKCIYRILDRQTKLTRPGKKPGTATKKK